MLDLGEHSAKNLTRKGGSMTLEGNTDVLYDSVATQQAATF